MTYLFSSSQISRGRGYFGRSAASSFAMMSLHSATHSSQMKTRGPEMSLRTSRRRFPQNEQWKSSIGGPVLHPALGHAKRARGIVSAGPSGGGEKGGKGQERRLIFFGSFSSSYSNSCGSAC